MSSQFASDLRLARRKAGYTQDDIAHLLSRHQTVVSDLEMGKRTPSVTEIVTLSLIFGRSFESLFADVMRKSKEHLSVRLATLPKPRRRYASLANRPGSLRRLRRRLAHGPDHGA